MDSIKDKKNIPHSRIVPRSHEPEIVATGTKRVWWRWDDVYVRLLATSWLNVAAMIITLYLTANIAFACAYLAIGDGIEHARHGSFSDAFFFSVETMATIGYGEMFPKGLAAKMLMTVQALSGFGFFAVVTGLVFAKFSRPTARVMFSDVAVISPYEGVAHLMIRLANERNNRIVDANIHLVMLSNPKNKEGHHMRRFIDLVPLRNKAPLIRFSWTLMHRIDETSPLYGMDKDALRESESEIIVSLTGLDETLAQTIHARFSYVAEEIIFNARYKDVLLRGEDGRLHVNYEHFHDIIPI